MLGSAGTLTGQGYRNPVHELWWIHSQEQAQHGFVFKQTKGRIIHIFYIIRRYSSYIKTAWNEFWQLTFLIDNNMALFFILALFFKELWSINLTSVHPNGNPLNCKAQFHHSGISYGHQSACNFQWYIFPPRRNQSQDTMTGPVTARRSTQERALGHEPAQAVQSVRFLLRTR